jgi:hypothetical protein
VKFTRKEVNKMDDNKKADEQSEAQVQEPAVESPTTEEPTEEVEETVEPEASGTTEEPTETEEKPKKGFQSRVKELVKERDEAKEQAQSLAQRLEELTGSVEPIQGQYTPQYEPGTEVTPEQYQQDVTRTADSLVQLRLKQSEAVNRINNESRDAIRKYPELDPDSESFNKELSDSITEAVEAHVKVNPYSASVSTIVDKLMKPYKGAVSKEVGQATENIAKQVSETALRPTSVKSGEKTAKEKSIAELEQELGIVQA